MPQTYNVGIDCRFWGIQHAGLGRYTRELVLAMLAQKPEEITFTLFINPEDYQGDFEKLKHCHIVPLSIPHYSLSEQLNLGGIIDKEQLDLVHFPHFNIPILSKTSFVVTIHDLIKHFFKGKPVTTKNMFIYWLKYAGYRLTIQQAITRSLKIITPSVFAKDQVVVHYPNIDPKKIVTIYEGVSVEFSSQQKLAITPLLKKYQLTIPYFVYTGSAYPSKDIPTLLRAIKGLIDKNIQVKLIISCARSVFWERLNKEIKEMDIEKWVVMPGNVPDQVLASLYRHAVSFVTPSLMEGFGLPGLEAMACGCPVIATNTGSLPEVYGNAASYFDPGNWEMLADKMLLLLNEQENKRNKRIQLCLNTVKQYSWRKAAKETLSVYLRALHKQ